MKKLSALLILLFLIGCSASMEPFLIKDKTDPVTNKRTLYSSGNYLKSEHSFDLSLDIQIDGKGTSKQFQFLLLRYEWSSWAFIKNGESLIFNVDGEVIKFYSESGSEGARNVGSYGSVVEYAPYKFDKRKLEKIINGKKVIGKVITGQFDLNFEVTPENQKNFKAMLTQL